MKRFIQNAKENMLLWRMFLLKAAFSSLVTLGAAYQVGTQNINMGSLDFWERVSLAVGIFVLWGNNMISLLDKTASQLQSGAIPGFQQIDTSLTKRENADGSTVTTAAQSATAVTETEPNPDEPKTP